MKRYIINFTLAGFDNQGEEHRLTTHTYNTFVRTNEIHLEAANNLMQFVSKLLKVPVDQVPVNAIVVKSAWLRADNSKDSRIRPRDLLKSAVEEGVVSPNGRGDTHKTLNTQNKGPIERRTRRSY